MSTHIRSNIIKRDLPIEFFELNFKYFFYEIYVINIIKSILNDLFRNELIVNIYDYWTII